MLNRLKQLPGTFFLTALLAASFVGDFNGASLGYAPVSAGPGLVIFSGSSNGQGPGVAASMTDFPAILTPLAGFQLTRTGAALNSTPTWVHEAKTAAAARTAGIGGSYPSGTCGGELQCAQVLNTANPGLWGGATFTLDGSCLDPAWEWLNPAYPVGQSQMMLQLFAAIDAAIIEHGKPVKAFVWMHGNDANKPEAVNYYLNMVNIFNQVRLRYGDIALIIERLTNKNTAGSVQIVRTAMESFVMANPKARLVRTDDLDMRDTAHYADDAGGVKGYCEFGNRLAAAIISGVNSTVDLTTPFWGVQANIIVALSGGLAACPLPYVYGTYNNKADWAILWYSGASNVTVPAPSGWTQVTNSPQWGGGASDARIHVYIKQLGSGETAPTIADVASDEAKAAGIGVVRNSSGLDGTPVGNSLTTAAASATVTWTGPTTTADNCLIVHLVAYRIDAATPQCSGYTNAALTNLEEQVDFDTTSGTGYGMGIATGVLAAHGAVGTTTATLASSVSQARLTLAFKP